MDGALPAFVRLTGKCEPDTRTRHDIGFGRRVVYAWTPHSHEEAPMVCFRRPSAPGGRANRSFVFGVTPGPDGKFRVRRVREALAHARVFGAISEEMRLRVNVACRIPEASSSDRRERP
jgi:hypothetical protein